MEKVVLGIMGSPRTDAGQGTSADVTFTIQRKFRPLRLIVPSGDNWGVADGRVTDVKVNGVSVMASTDPVSMDCFVNLNFMPGLINFGDCVLDVGSTIVVSVDSTGVLSPDYHIAIEGEYLLDMGSC